MIETEHNTLSHAYINEKPDQENYDEFEVMSVESISPTRMEELRKITSTDPTMQKLVQVIQSGWPAKYREVPHELAEYFSVRDELVIDNGVILKSQRVVVPESLHCVYIEQVHRGHPGVEATKRRARDVVYWPTMTKDIEYVISLCKPCNSTKRAEPMPLIIGRSG